ncbi:hypothetical protein C8Q75DRAFT_791424 [Abortiporus biennis]|nr:hypothetical protein C8Q75DRAFT_791424 [Abortiporus biennis]
MATNVTLRESQAVNTPRIRTPPKKISIKIPFDYTPSDDGTDENLLILLHGLGDTQIPFARLGRQLKLPQTATLALRAPEQIPFLYEDAYQWYTSFDELGEVVSRPNPTPALELLDSVFKHLTEDCAWPPEKIHMFGFAQGGSVAVEFGIRWWKNELEKQRKQQKDTETPYTPKALGSIVTVAGPLLSYPTLSKPSSTPILAIYRPYPAETTLSPSALSDLKKAYTYCHDVAIGSGEGMPRSKEEWEPIMRFWSEKLSRRQVEGLYEVLSGGPAM